MQRTVRATDHDTEGLTPAVLGADPLTAVTKVLNHDRGVVEATNNCGDCSRVGTRDSGLNSWAAFDVDVDW